MQRTTVPSASRIKPTGLQILQHKLIIPLLLDPTILCPTGSPSFAMCRSCVPRFLTILRFLLIPYCMMTSQALCIPQRCCGLWQQNGVAHSRQPYGRLRFEHYCRTSVTRGLWVTQPAAILSEEADGFGGLVVSMLAIRVRGFKPDRSRWIFRASEKSSACLPSVGKWKNLSHVPALRHVKEPSASVNYDVLAKFLV